MAEDLYIIQGSKEDQYQSLIPQLKGLLAGEPDLVANMANTVAALKEQFRWFWVGFYVYKRKRTGAGSVPGAGCMYQNKKRKRRLREQLARS